MTRKSLAGLFAAVSTLSLVTPAQAGEPTSPQAASGARDFQIMVRADRRALDRVLVVRQEASPSKDETVFAIFSNYRAFVSRFEIRIFAPGDTASTGKPLAVVPVDGDGRVRIALRGDLPQGAGYTLRAYGANGVWDETRLHPLLVNDQLPKANAIFEQVDDTDRRSISLKGVMLTVQGRASAGQQSVLVDGQDVPVDKNGLFAMQQIVPSSRGQVRVEIREGQTPVVVAERSYNADEHRWFVVGQGDLTFSHSIANGPADIVSGDPLLKGNNLSSRGAFYAKGVVGNDYRVTASLDTGEVLFKDMLRNLDRKDPAQLLRRIDERYQYPTFGDGSTIVEDAPSQGRFYARVQKNDSNFVVGNFIASSQGTELVQLDRGLFGAMLDLKSTRKTRNGDRRSQFFAFASDPGTITTSDELRGTGGSLFYLRHQDLSVGSERLRLEVRSAETGAILTSSPLKVDEDYTIDYFQGRVTLLRPLSSYVSGGELVRPAGAAGANVPVLVARYEYSPPAGALNGHSIGGRATQWLGDWLRVGLTGQSETAGPADQLVLGGDIMVKASQDTWLKGEIGRTDGPGFSQASSLDGGLHFNEQLSTAQAGRVARAFRIEGALDQRDISSSLRGKASGFYENYEAGFAAMGRISPKPMSRWGGKWDQPIGTNSALGFAVEGRRDEGTGGTDLARAEWKLGLSSDWSLRTGLRYENTRIGNSLLAQGQRLDGGAQLTFEPLGQNWSVYGFGQGTVEHDASRNKNNRLGLGLKTSLSQSLSAQGEVSDGTGGWAANAMLSRKGRGGAESHIGYRLYSDVTDRGYDPQELMVQPSRGVLALGSQQPLTNNLTLTGSEKFGHGGGAPSLAHAYGLKFTPGKAWSIDLGGEKTTIFDKSSAGQGKIDRSALSFAVGYVQDTLMVSSAVEYRRDKQATGSQTSWLFKDKVEIRPDDALRLMGHFEYAFTDVAGTSLNAADFTRAVVGAAYRPVTNDRLNLLARFTYFRDLGPAGQIMTNGGVEQPKQVSQVISVDASYDLADWLTLGAKYAHRQGRVSITRGSDVFVNSAADLYIGRADIRFTRNWDALIEGRNLTASLDHGNRLGILAALYRRLGKTMKIGAGYNFTDYSSDLTDQSYTAKGMFVNLLAAF